MTRNSTMCSRICICVCVCICIHIRIRIRIRIRMCCVVAASHRRLSGGKEKKQHHRPVSRSVVHCPPSSGIPLRGLWSGRVAIAAVVFAVAFNSVVVAVVLAVVVFFVIICYHLSLVCRTESFPPLFTCRSDLLLPPPPPPPTSIVTPNSLLLGHFMYKIGEIE